MSTRPWLVSLLAWLAEAPRGWGWDMIFAYDLRVLNELLLAHYIEGYNLGHQLPLISDRIETTYTTEHLSSLRLHMPLASFERAGLDADSLQLSLDILSGLVITEQHQRGPSIIARIRQLSPVGSPRLILAAALASMTVDIDASQAMRLDLSAAEDFRSSFSLDTLSQAQIGARFKEIFRSLPDNLQRFPFGRVNELADPPLALRLRLMHTADPDDSALLMFARLYGQYDGTMPSEGEDFPFPIPAGTAKSDFSLTWLMFNDAAAFATEDMQRSDFPFLFDEMFFPDDFDFYIHALGLQLEYRQSAFYGTLEPRTRLFSLSPRMPVMVAGGQKQFIASTPVNNLKWSLRPGGPDVVDVGTITGAGLYSAPAKNSQLPPCSTVIVSAEGSIDGQRAWASTLVSVLGRSIGASPLFAICNAGALTQMTASTPPGGPTPRWSLRDPGLGGSLLREEGVVGSYRAAEAGTSPGGEMYLDIVDVRNPNTGDSEPVYILVLSAILSLQVLIGADSRLEYNEVQLQVLLDGVPVDLGDIKYPVTVTMHGYTGGSVDAKGLYKAPADASGVVILMLTADDGFMDWYGVLALPLPLGQHVEALRHIGTSWQQRRRPT